MIGRFQVLSDRVPSDGNAFFHDDLCLFESERVAFNRV